jgi:succinate-semialdehyde dehydrogenase/glutarate-semialdehyde dehydrogenase
VSNPATGELLAEVPLMAGDECERAIESAYSAMRSRLSLEARRLALQSIADQLLQNKSEFGRLITLEHGKPHREGIAEVEYAAGFFSHFATQLDRLQSHELRQPIKGSRWCVHFRPAGVAGAISSWNFPLAMIAKKVAAALGAGCGVVVKPAGLAPLSAIALSAIAEKAGVPAGMLNVVMGNSHAIGSALCAHDAVRIISFTGSTDVGKILAKTAAPHLKRLTLELGGNAPFIVFSDAELDAAADSLMANKFRSGGQTCVCANRVYVHCDVAQEFTSKIAQRVKKLRVGNGMEPTTDIGPLIDRAAFDKVAAHVSDALAGGAVRLVGEDVPRPEHNWGCFYPPTLLVNVHHKMRVCREETFGPVIALTEFGDDDEIVNLANCTESGLAAFLFTTNSDLVRFLLPHLHFGHVGVNTGAGPTPEAPFGGMKESGYGREGGLEGLFEYCELQTEVTGAR